MAAASSAALLAGSVMAQLERQHDTHVHGTAMGNLSMDGNALRLELEIPGINLVGFEHPPASDQQRSELDSALAFLREANWLATDPRANCELASMSVHAHGFSADDIHDHHEHEHEPHEGRHDHAHPGDDHHHDHGHGSAQDHAEFHLLVTLECQSGERLSWVDLQLFEAYPGNAEIVVDVLTERVATQARLSAGNVRIGLE